MKKIYLPLIVLFSTILLILFVFYNRYSNYYKDEQISRYVSKNIGILNENLEFEKRYALSLSLMVSKNNTLKEALKADNRDVALKELELVIKEIEHTTHTKIDIQIHTKDLKAFARSWDRSNYYGADLSFRRGLKIVQKSQAPFVSIELGKRLNIKAISPIFDKHRYIGSIEVIMGFSGIKKRLKKFGLTILGLLDKKYIDVAVDLKDNAKIANYYVVEKSYPKELFNLLQKNRYILNGKKFYYKIGKNIVTIIPMKSVGIVDVGKIALLMRAEQKQELSIEEPSLNNYQFKGTKRKVIIK